MMNLAKSWKYERYVQRFEYIELKEETFCISLEITCSRYILSKSIKTLQWKSDIFEHIWNRACDKIIFQVIIMLITSLLDNRNEEKSRKSKKNNLI